MWHSVKFIASKNGIIPADLEGYALVYGHKYGVTHENGFCEVEARFVPALVSDYRAFREKTRGKFSD